MILNFSNHERNLIVKITGDIDHHTSEELRTKIEKEYKSQNAKNIIFDFDNVSFMDSSGIGVIIGRYKNIKKQGGSIGVVNVGDDIGRIFDISGLYKLLDPYKSMNEAIEKLQ